VELGTPDELATRLELGIALELATDELLAEMVEVIVGTDTETVEYGTELATRLELGIALELATEELLAEIVEVIVGTDTETVEYGTELEEGTETETEEGDATGTDELGRPVLLGTELDEEDE
jgi:hypothetical protein